jgi:predicted RNA methylase
MSATNRGSTRRDADYYPTPAWCVRALLASVQLPGWRWLEPAAGDGAIIRAVLEQRQDVSFAACEIDGAHETALENAGAALIRIDDFVNLERYEPVPTTPYYQVVITNPPFSQSLEFVEAALRRAPVVVMLLRLNWLASAKRNAFLRENPPSVYVLPRRPSFTGTGTDATDYAWMVWGIDQEPKLAVIDIEVCK